jgi:regulator of replication initiation timing
MAQVQFPQELAQVGRVSSGASLNEVRGILEELSGKTEEIAREVFDRIDQLEEGELVLNHTISDMQKELSELQISMNRLAPLEIATKLDLLQERIFSCPKPSTGLLQSNLNSLKDRFDHLHFQYVFPDTEELNPDSFQNNLLYRIEQRIESSDPEAATTLRESLSSLQQQCNAAEKIFQGKGLSAYFELPEPVRQDVEGRLFERFPDLSFNDLSTYPEGQVHLAAAIMASLSDRMMDAAL